MKIKLSSAWAAAAAACLLGATAHAQITKDLVVHLTFDGVNGSGYYTNTLSNGIDAQPVGAPYSVPGLIGPGAVSVTSEASLGNNYLTLGYPQELQFGAVSDNTATDFTVGFWCNYTNQSSDPVFIASQDWNSSNNKGWGIYMQGGGGIRLVAATPRTQISNPAGVILRSNGWHHVVVAFERRGNMSLYKDGVLAASTSMAGTTGSIDTFDLGYNVNIGQDGTGNYVAPIVDLYMDDLGIWRRALSPEEVQAIYTYGLGGTNLYRTPIVNPFLASTAPAAGATSVAPNRPTITAVITDGLSAVAPTSIQLSLNGVVVPVGTSKSGLDTTVTYTNTTVLPAGLNTAVLVFANSSTSPRYFTNSWSFTVSSYPTLSPALKVTADTSKPGFIFNVFANSGNTANSLARLEAALAGQLFDTTVLPPTPLPNWADNNAQGIAIAPAAAANPANAPLKFEIAGVINLNAVGGSANGSFTPDDQMPGMPAIDGSLNGVAAEIITYLELPVGLTTMGITSDDLFRTTAGLPAQDMFKSLQLATGSGEVMFYLNVQEAGVYAFRTAWENATGASYVEWFTRKPDGTKVLVNDTANGGIRAYRGSSTPYPPYVKYAAPLFARQENQLSSSMVVVVADGSTAVEDNSIQLKLDDAVIPATKVRGGNQVTLTYTPTGIQFPEAQHLAELSFKGVGTTATTTARWSFCSLNNIVLPTPVIVENFDSYTEGEIPTGWAATNYTDTATAGLNLDDLNSDSYKGWIVVSQSRLAGLKGRIFQGTAPNQFSNSVPLTIENLSSGNLIYAESDVRGGNQVQFLYTKPYNLSAVQNAAVAFASLYEQNQDNIAGVEYSVDGGVSWLPVVYYLDFVDGGGDIVYDADGMVNAVTTLTAANTDTAYWTQNAVAKGGKYGDALAAPISQALSRFIAPRANDDRYDGKRFEIYRLPAAGGKSDVRLRFHQIGTGSWYFGVDNLAFYDVAAPVQPRLTAAKASATALSLYWIGAGTLQEAPSPTGPWTVTASQANPQTITIGTGTKFYRIGLP